MGQKVCTSSEIAANGSVTTDLRIGISHFVPFVLQIAGFHGHDNVLCLAGLRQHKHPRWMVSLSCTARSGRVVSFVFYEIAIGRKCHANTPACGCIAEGPLRTQAVFLVTVVVDCLCSFAILIGAPFQLRFSSIGTESIVMTKLIHWSRGLVSQLDRETSRQLCSLV
jgi:hypothetical protein